MKGTRNMERVKELRERLASGEEEALEYSDKLVRDFIERIDVFETKLLFTMKNGMKTEVEVK